MKDFLEMRALEGNGLSPYEQYKVGFLQQKNHTSGIGVAGLVLGTVGAAAAVGAWIFGPTYANAKSNQAKEAALAAKEIASVQIAASQRQIDQLTNLFAAERQERIAGDVNITTTISDTLSGQQSGTLTATQQAELNAAQQLMFGLSTGEYSRNPQRVAIYQDAKPCACPGSCGCNG